MPAALTLALLGLAIPSASLVLALGLVLLLVLLRGLNRRAGRGLGVLRRPGSEASPTRQVLTAQHSVHVVELGGCRLLVGTGPSGAPRVLADLCEFEVAAPSSVLGDLPDREGRLRSGPLRSVRRDAGGA